MTNYVAPGESEPASIRRPRSHQVLVETSQNVTFILNTTEVNERDRQEFVHTALGMTMVPIDLYWPQHHDGVKARRVITDIGDLTVCTGQTTAYRVERTPGSLATRWNRASSSTCSISARAWSSSMTVKQLVTRASWSCGFGHPWDVLLDLHTV